MKARRIARSVSRGIKTFLSLINFVIYITVFIVLILPLSSNKVFSQTPKETEYRFKAVYILNFLQFIEWPDSIYENEHSPLIVSVVGEDPFGSILDETFNNEKIGVHPILVNRFRSINQIGKCNVVFICSSENNITEDILTRINQTSILTVSDIKNFGTQGGSIGFYLEKNKVRFEINLKALKQGDLKASSKLLRLAKIINPIE